MVGTNGMVHADLVTFEDAAADFSALLPDRTLTIPTGANMGTYLISAVVSQHQLQIATSFVVEQLGQIGYQIDAFPHGVRIDKRIRSVPTLQDLTDSPTHVLAEGVDFVVQDGILALRSAFPMMDYGPVESRAMSMWAEKVLVDYETPRGLDSLGCGHTQMRSQARPPKD